jgi:quercetin dioxygenase-like cupin family protein
MVIYEFDPARGRPISQFSSQGVTFVPLVHAAPAMSAACMYLEPGGLIGRHEATVEQLLLVVQGGGVVSGGDGDPVVVRPGLAALWAAGEWHETRAGADGLTALVIEGDGLSAAGVLRMMRAKQ